MKRKEVDLNRVTPMMRQYIEIKNENPNVLVFFRLGDFYEMFFEDAVLVSRELELTLTGKNAGLDERIPMCGIPHHAINVYVEKLIEKGYKIGICEQLEDPKNAKGIVKRGLTQIISKGTVINTDSLNEREYNYIGAVIDFDHCYSLCYLDVLIGMIYTIIIPHSKTKLVSDIVSLGIKEIVVNDIFDKEILDLLNKQFNIDITVYNEINEFDEYKYIYEDLSDIRHVKVIKYLLTYIDSTQMRKLSHLQKAIIIKNEDYLKMDIHTKRNLELTETIRLHERTYSLIWLLDKTKTAMGSRMLKEMIEKPLINVNKINERYDVITTLLNEFIIKNDLQTLLTEVYDLERISGKIAFGSANARDLLQLKTSIKVLPQIKSILEKINFHDSIETLNELFVLLDNSIYENPPLSLKEGYLIKEKYNCELDELKSLRKGGKDFIATFENEEKERTGIKNLKVGFNKVFGYYIEISKGNISLIKDEYGYERRQTLSNCERYISPILKEKEALILNAEEKIIELEYNLFMTIKDEVKTYIPRLQKIAKTISEIDVMQSFATISEENNFVRPNIIDKRIIDIKDGRHPVVEKVLKDNVYVPNDVYMDENTDILLITGPNMAGKSTYMRELAIIIVMAQIGCFVPASSARVPIIDAIYTRIGASDDLVSGESTFMVEMKEANYAISNATSNSLILFDELGRGTATFDGMALAQSIIEYISHKIKAKTLFSTHYHELTDLEKTLDDVKNIHVSAYEENGNIVFLHKIKTGSVDKSYGIHVASLANLPKELIERATNILKIYENKENKRDVIIQETLPIDDLLKAEKSIIEKDLEAIDPYNITPLEALNIIIELKNKLNKDE